MSEQAASQLRAQRKRLGLTRDQIAGVVGVPRNTLRRWEDGTRKPDEARLRLLLDALEFSRADANVLLESFDYAPQASSNNPALRPTWYQLQDLDAVVNRVPWPAFVANEISEILSANGAFQALANVDLRHEFTEGWERNLVMVASNPRFADRVGNWDELVSILIAIAKGSHYRPQNLESPSPYFARVLEEFARGEPRYVKRFAQLWDSVTLLENRQRWEYPVIWNDPEHGRLDLLGLVVSSDHTQTMVTFHDWVPVNADSWMRLEAVKARWRKAHR